MLLSVTSGAARDKCEPHCSNHTSIVGGDKEWECLIAVTIWEGNVSRATQERMKGRKGLFPSTPFLVSLVENSSPLTAKPPVVTKKKELSWWLEAGFELWRHKFSFFKVNLTVFLNWETFLFRETSLKRTGFALLTESMANNILAIWLVRGSFTSAVCALNL